MTLPLIITPEAEEDIADAKDWYDQQRQGLGGAFVLCVEETLDRIRSMPEAAAEIFPGGTSRDSPAIPLGDLLPS
jgi:hypothetical protein